MWATRGEVRSEQPQAVTAQRRSVAWRSCDWMILRTGVTRRLAVLSRTPSPSPTWRRSLAAQPPCGQGRDSQQRGTADYEARANSFAYKVGGLLGQGVSSIQRRANESGALDAASKLKDDGFKVAGVDKQTGDTALKAAGGLWLLARTVHKVRKVAVGAIVAGAAYGVARAHSPKTADRVLEVSKVGLEKGGVLGSSFWSGVATGMGDDSKFAETDDENPKVVTTGSGWGGRGSIEHFMRTEVRALTPGVDYARAMRSEGYDSMAMLVQLAKDDQCRSGNASSTDWTRMVDACGVKAGDAVKIKEALLRTS